MIETTAEEEEHFAAIRASFLAMCREDLPAGFNLAEFERNPDLAFYLLMKLVVDAQAEGLGDPVPWFSEWCASCLDGPVFGVSLPRGGRTLN